MLIRAIRGPEVYGIGEKRFEHGELVAASMCQGGAPKRYPHTDPNEDAAIAAESPTAMLVVVADAHSGSAASSIAIEWLAEHRAQQWLAAPPSPERWPDEALDTFFEIHQAIAAANEKASEFSETTLALALFDRRENRILFGNAGDSHIFLVGDRFTDEITGYDRGFFLGGVDSDREYIAAHTERGAVARDDCFAVVCATDGVSSPSIGFDDPVEDIARIARATPRRSEDLVRSLMNEACSVQMTKNRGDNIAIAVAVIDAQPTTPG